MDSIIHQINLYPVDSPIMVVSPKVILDSDLFCLNNWGQVNIPYLPVYNAHFFYDIWGWKITLRIIHGTFCFRSATHLHKQKKQ